MYYICKKKKKTFKIIFSLLMYLFDLKKKINSMLKSSMLEFQSAAVVKLLHW